MKEIERAKPQVVRHYADSGYHTIRMMQTRVFNYFRLHIEGMTLEGQLGKLKEEAKELIDAINRGAPLAEIAEEWCDSGVVMCNVASLGGLCLERAWEAKQTKNEQRTWASHQGRAQHTKEGE